MILRLIAERRDSRRDHHGLIGFAWNVATFLVVPVLAAEGVGPIEAIKRSGGYLRRTWGEQIIGNVGIGLVFGLLLIAIMFIGIAVILFQTPCRRLAIVAAIVLLLTLGIVGLIGSAVSGIYVASIYRYATKGDGGPMFTPEVLAGAFRQRR